MDRYRLKEVREEYNKENRDKGIEINQEHMGNKCGAGKSTISRIERGEVEPPPNVLTGYADTFGVSVDYLLRRTDAKNPEHMTAGRELGLSDEAIETLRFIRKNAAYKDYDISAFVSAFIGSGEATFSFFDNLFNMMSAEYGFSKYNPQTEVERQRYFDRLIQGMADRIQEYIKYEVMPQLESVIERCYEAVEQNELHTQNQKESREKRQG